MALSLAQNAIAFLIDLAERGEIDPWDVKVIDVIDRFLNQLQLQPVSQESGQAPYEANLSESGQAFLYASMLVLLKADTLARLDGEEEEEELEDDFLDDAALEIDRPRNLEQRIRRRAVASPPKNRRVTLQELIDQLQLIAGAIAEHKPRVRARRPRPQSRNQAVRAITQLAHQENLSEIAAVLEQFLNQYWPEMSQGEEWLDFEILLDLWPNAQNPSEPSHLQSPPSEQSAVPNSGHSGAESDHELEHESVHKDRVGVFWALLFLSAQSKVELSQESFYQDLKVRSLADLDINELLGAVDGAVEPD